LTKTFVSNCNIHPFFNFSLKFIEENAGKSVRVFPIVFFEKKFIGGYTDTEYHYNRLNAFSNNLFF